MKFTRFNLSQFRLSLHGCSCGGEHDASDHSKHLRRARGQPIIRIEYGDIARAKAESPSAHHKISKLETHPTSHSLDHDYMFRPLMAESAKRRSAMPCKCIDIQAVSFSGARQSLTMQCLITAQSEPQSLSAGEIIDCALPSSPHANRRSEMTKKSFVAGGNQLTCMIDTV